jgi:hypothetical protein
VANAPSRTAAPAVTNRVRVAVVVDVMMKATGNNCTRPLP